MSAGTAQCHQRESVSLVLACRERGAAQPKTVRNRAPPLERCLWHSECRRRAATSTYLSSRRVARTPSCRLCRARAGCGASAGPREAMFCADDRRAGIALGDRALPPAPPIQVRKEPRGSSLGGRKEYVGQTHSGPASHSSAHACSRKRLREAVPERALQIAVDVGRRCSVCASGLTRRLKKN